MRQRIQGIITELTVASSQGVVHKCRVNTDRYHGLVLAQILPGDGGHITALDPSLVALPHGSEGHQERPHQVAGAAAVRVLGAAPVSSGSVQGTFLNWTEVLIRLVSILQCFL